MRPLFVSFLIVVCCSFTSLVAADSTGRSPASDRWQFSGNLYYYALPDESDLLGPVVSARTGQLHLEGRYNYEDRNTVSLFAGYVFQTDGKFRVEFVPLAGLALGNIHGLVPGIELTASLTPLEFYSEVEYLIDLADDSASFFYVWSQLTVSLPAGFQAGVVGQRTVLYQTDPEVNPGILAGFQRDAWGGALCLFNPGRDDSYLLLSLSANF